MSNKLRKAGTMVIAAEEGNEYLKRTWGNDKFEAIQAFKQIDYESKPEESSSSCEEEKVKPAASKNKLKKNTTMLETLKASEYILENSNIHEEAKTRRQSERISKLLATPKLVKHSTMVATAKESELILKDVDIDQDARTRKQASAIKRLTTPKKTLKKNRTINETTKDATNFIKRQPLKSKAGRRKRK